MLRVLALLRHGLASGQARSAPLLPEGTAYLRRLGAVLRAEHWRPGVILTSPYVRASDSAAILALTLGCTRAPQALEELAPEIEPALALAAILAADPQATPILVVSHLPLVGRLAHELLGEDPGFSPGTFVEIEREGSGVARLIRHIRPRDLAGIP